MSEIVYGATPCLCVEKVEATKDYRLILTFSDGKQSTFDFRPLLQKNIYSDLKNISLFLKAETDGCGVVWNDDIDIAAMCLIDWLFLFCFWVKLP